jgi:hypothetical protein
MRAIPAATFLLGLLSMGARPGGGEAAPPQLSQTGLYSDPAKLAVDPANRPYAPQYPLWSDGAAKTRWVRLPPGSRIDAATLDAWKFPPGTRFWKEFAFAGRKVETRMLWRGASGWQYATYLWNPDQTDATLASTDGVKSYFPLGEGKSHNIPSVKDCRTCHENGGPEVLGFTALQLSPDRDPLAPHAEPLQPGMVTLATLLQEGRLLSAPAGLAERPPRIPAATLRERAALGYLAANCGNCHPGNSAVLARLGLDLRVPAAARDAATLPWRGSALEVAGKTSITDAPEGQTRRIKAGAPDLSTVPYRMASRRPARQMPPLGSVLPDQAALDLIRAWIAEDLAAPKR